MHNKFYFNSRLLFLSFSVLIMLSINNVTANEKAGLVIYGIDTLFINGYLFGFDFVMQRACTSSTDNQCNAHFNIGWSTENFYLAWIMGQGLALDLGKLNLDSIKAAPPDSLMKDNLGLGQLFRIFRIAQDSLQNCLGNCYIIKTAIDPRPAIKVHFYSKFKILKIMVVDSTNHYIKMVLLWAYNSDALHDLTTSGIDTFHLETPTLNQSGRNLLRNEKYASMNQHAFKVVENDFRLPQAFLGKVKSFSIWNSQGKKLAQIKMDKTNLLIQMPKNLKGKGLFILRAENTN
jgi:hypothetical protein